MDRAAQPRLLPGSRAWLKEAGQQGDGRELQELRLMARASEQSGNKGRLLRRPFAWMNRPLHLEWSSANLTWLAVAIGVILRVWEYLEFRTLYMDENSLLKNIVGRPLFGFHKVLEDDQMAPPGFLVIERLIVRLPMEVAAAGRLFPLFCGIASVFLTRSVAKRFLDPRAVPWRLACWRSETICSTTRPRSSNIPAT
jgi:hypothetical protein